MASRFLDAGVALAAVLSAAVLALMLAAPVLPGAVPVRGPVSSSTPEPSSTAAPDLPPLGLFLLRGPFAFGPCLGLELSPPSYPVGEDAGLGLATVLWWERGMTGCDSRTREVAEVQATVERLGREGAPDDTVGYLVAFELQLADGIDASVELTILAARSTQEILQVTDTSGVGQGLVFDRVESIDPPLDPVPTPTPVAFEPKGLYLLAGPLDSDGPCLVLELGDDSYPADPNTTGTARVRWWERAVADPGNPAECLRRAGDVSDVPASVVAMTDAEGNLVSYAIAFSVPVPATGSPQDVEVSVLVGQSTQDQIRATVIRPGGVPSLVLDRVDSIDPPLGP